MMTPHYLTNPHCKALDLGKCHLRSPSSPTLASPFSPSKTSVRRPNPTLASDLITLALQLQECGENTSRHGRAPFSMWLVQDLAVVVLLILIPLISPSSSNGGLGFQAIAKALRLAAVKGVVAISAIIAGGRLLLRPIYKQIAGNQNAEIFSTNTLLVILGTSLLTIELLPPKKSCMN